VAESPTLSKLTFECKSLKQISAILLELYRTYVLTDAPYVQALEGDVWIIDRFLERGIHNYKKFIDS